MKTTNQKALSYWLCIFVSSCVLYGAGWLHGRYMVGKSPFAFSFVKVDGTVHHQDDGHDHASHDESHAESNSLELSDAARKNLGLTNEYLDPIELSSFHKTITVPANGATWRLEASRWSVPGAAMQARPLIS